MPRGENRPSLLLTKEENDLVFSLIGPKCQSLATAVVQLFTTDGPAHNEWKKKDTGVLCLIKDNGRRSYFFRLYCLYRKITVWEHEVYIQIEYKSPRPYLHTFEAEEYMTAFNFANEDEARTLRNILIEKIELRKHRREERRQRSMLASRANTGALSGPGGGAGGPPSRLNGAPPPPPTPAPAPPKTIVTSNYTSKSSGGKKPKSRKLTKADIGMPLDFKHVSHVGWDANKGFDVNVNSLPAEEMRSFFRKVGISETQLQDEATMEFVYDFINDHGGIDAVKEELTESPPVKQISKPSVAPPVPSRSPAPSLPPGPPSRAPPPPPSRAVPPPPPPPASLVTSPPAAAAAAAPAAPRNPPPPRPTHPPSTAPPPPPAAAPPPPPPPPPPPAAPPAAPSLPPATPSAATAAAASDPRAALMESIRAGNKNLKHVDVGAKAPVESSRSDLLSEIRQGIELRAVSRETSAATLERRGAAQSGLAGALARALHERSRAIHSSDSELSDATTSDGEWDD